MLDIKTLLNEKVLIFDGAAGTSLINLALSEDDYDGYKNCHDYLCISRPDVVKNIHESFFKAGCDIVETNSFGANSIVLKGYGLEHRTYEINFEAAKLAKEVAIKFSSDNKPRFVSGSLGPGSKLPSLGDISFDECSNAYYKQALGLIDGGVDIFQIETCQDLIQIKAAYIGVRKAIDELKKEIPIIIQVTVDKGKMLLGTDIQGVVAAFSSFDLFALGVNCGTGPEGMKEAVRQLSRISPFPISVLPNAGLPKLVNGNPVYDLSPENFANQLKDFVLKDGVALVGGCCGTTPEHIKELVSCLDNVKPAIRNVNYIPSLSSLYLSQSIKVEPAPLISGEKTNSNGSKAFREALLSNDLDKMVEVALAQEREGAHILDVSVAYAGRDEVKDLSLFAEKLNKELKIPLMIDSTNQKAIEECLKRTAGKSVINSINLEDGGDKAKEILTIANKYGSAVVALVIDEDGMAKTVDKKLKIADRLIKLCRRFGINDNDIFIDLLTFTLGSGDKTLYNAGVETLNAITLLKEKYPNVNTILGVSNISFGLKPKIRKIINAVFLYLAVQKGLDAAIFHAGKLVPVHVIDRDLYKLANDLILNKRTYDFDPLEKIMSIEAVDVKNEIDDKLLTLEEKLENAIITGSKKDLEDSLKLALRKYTGLQIINEILLPAMERVGEMFGSGEIQLPFVLKSAEVMRFSVDFLKPFFDKKDLKNKGSILLATVKGDVHDIGKNLVDIILSNNGYVVHNIGININNEVIVENILKFKPDYLGLSGLLVKSAFVMKELLIVLNNSTINIPVFCGGAALTREYVETELQEVYKGQVFYSKDAFDAVNVIEKKGIDKKTKSKNNEKSKEEVIITKGNLSPLEPVEVENVPNPKFIGTKKVEPCFIDLKDFMNKKLLFSQKWKENNVVYAEKKLKEIEDYCLANNLFDFKGKVGFFKCNADENSLVVNDNLELNFEREKNFPNRCLADYFRKDKDVLSLFIVTLGSKFVNYLSDLYEENNYQEYYEYYHFGNVVVEAFADYVHNIIRKDLVISEKAGKRYSPGYTVWQELSEQQKLFDLLKADEIGLSLSETYQIQPEQSISALVVHNPSATYFSI